MGYDLCSCTSSEEDSPEVSPTRKRSRRERAGLGRGRGGGRGRDEDEVLPEDVEQDRVAEAVTVHHNGVPIHPQSQYSPSIDLLAQPSLCLLAS